MLKLDCLTLEGPLTLKKGNQWILLIGLLRETFLDLPIEVKEM